MIKTTTWIKTTKSNLKLLKTEWSFEPARASMYAIFPSNFFIFGCAVKKKPGDVDDVMLSTTDVFYVSLVKLKTNGSTRTQKQKLAR